MSMTAAEVLAGARDVLAERGWTQGSFEDAAGSVCLVGSLTRQSPRPSVLEFQDALHYLRLVVEMPMDWNDRAERTYEDVVLALKQAEELALEGAA